MSKRKKRIKKAPATRYLPENLIDAAKKAGFVPKQIAGFPDADSLKGAVLRVNPRLLHMVQDKPAGPPAPKPITYVDKEAVTEVYVLAGQGNQANRATKEQREIDSFIRRNGIKRVQKMSIFRYYKADRNNKVKSDVRIEYQVEEK